jgi:hypothetical protein
MSSPHTSSKEPNELHIYQSILSGNEVGGGSGQRGPTKEELNAPLIWWDAKEHLHTQQYAVLGHVPEETKSSSPKPVLLNTNAPWSAFLCGSQGSGKSHALSCMLENCLLSDEKIGKNPNPLAGLVFHYDRTEDVCEAAYLCSSVPTRVLVSTSNYGTMKERYEDMAAKQGGKIDVQRLLLLPDKHLDTSRMKTLMATGRDGEMPLYMHVSLPPPNL